MGLTVEGLIFMSLAWGIIIALTAFSFYKVFKGEKNK